MCPDWLGWKPDGRTLTQTIIRVLEFIKQQKNIFSFEMIDQHL